MELKYQTSSVGSPWIEDRDPTRDQLTWDNISKCLAGDFLICIEDGGRLVYKMGLFCMYPKSKNGTAKSREWGRWDVVFQR